MASFNSHDVSVYGMKSHGVTIDFDPFLGGCVVCFAGRIFFQLHHVKFIGFVILLLMMFHVLSCD